jgi:hypothetical protein
MRYSALVAPTAYIKLELFFQVFLKFQAPAYNSFWFVCGVWNQSTLIWRKC